MQPKTTLLCTQKLNNSVNVDLKISILSVNIGTEENEPLDSKLTSQSLIVYGR
jgi:hypothetical protein